MKYTTKLSDCKTIAKLTDWALRQGISKDTIKDIPNIVKKYPIIEIKNN